MNPEQIKTITDSVKPAYCLVGARFFDKKLQQNICLDTSHRCECKEIFEKAIMKYEQILEGNKLIGVFDGATFVNDAPEEYPNGYYIGELDEMLPENWNYHVSWDWLMPVIEKICKTEIIEAEHRQDTYYIRTFGMLNEETGNPMFRFYCCSVFEAETLIEAAWMAVVDFIKTNNTTT
jgi:hypothetical protein